jgi:hypothetical protein
VVAPPSNQMNCQRIQTGLMEIMRHEKDGDNAPIPPFIKTIFLPATQARWFVTNNDALRPVVSQLSSTGVPFEGLGGGVAWQCVVLSLSQGQARRPTVTRHTSHRTSVKGA